MTTYTVGQRVTTSKGTGTVRGFEHLTKGACYVDEHDAGPGAAYPCRIMVEMDDASAWTPTEHTPHPFMFRHEVAPIES